MKDFERKYFVADGYVYEVTINCLGEVDYDLSSSHRKQRGRTAPNRACCCEETFEDELAKAIYELKNC